MFSRRRSEFPRHFKDRQTVMKNIILAKIAWCQYLRLHKGARNCTYHCFCSINTNMRTSKMQMISQCQSDNSLDFLQDVCRSRVKDRCPWTNGGQNLDSNTGLPHSNLRCPWQQSTGMGFLFPVHPPAHNTSFFPLSCKQLSLLCSVSYADCF